MAAPGQYVVDVRGVKEVGLAGTADLAFWRDRLHSEGLYPTNDNGRAAVVISATDLKWMGIRFNELSISVHVSRQADGRTVDGVFLVHAFNSKPLLALMERTFFQTPYYGGSIYGVEKSLPQMQLCAGQTLLFQASMVGQRQPEQQKAYLWEGPIYLPTNQTKKKQAGRCFYGRIRGSTKVYPFRVEDNLWLPPSPGDTVFHWLRESNFQAAEWQVRPQARHAKSKTMNQALPDHLTTTFAGS